VPVDLVLRLLNAQAELKSLLPHRNAGVQQHAICVASTMPDAQHRLRGSNVTARRVQASQATINDVQPFQAATKIVFTTKRFDPASKVPHDQRQAIAAQMRPLFVNQRRHAAAVDEPLQHPTDVRPAHPAGQLAVTECAGSALTEQVVIFGIVFASSLEGADGRHSLLDRLSPLDDQRPIPLQRQEVSREQPCRPRSDHDRPLLQWFAPRFSILELRRNKKLHLGRLVCQATLNQVPFRQLDYNRVDESEGAP
jgi:hypothetical protein